MSTHIIPNICPICEKELPLENEKENVIIIKQARLSKYRGDKRWNDLLKKGYYRAKYVPTMKLSYGIHINCWEKLNNENRTNNSK